MKRTGQIILGSRSPRRRELLGFIVPGERIRVVPPRDADEPGFAQLHDWAAIDKQLQAVARGKCDDVLAQVDSADVAAVVTADTTIVGQDEHANLRVLGQPPDDDTWRDVVREWFRRYLLPREHVAATAVRVATPDGSVRETLVKTRVQFDKSAADRVEWYLATGEPRGKAGGYGLQGAGGLFVSEIHGSISNVIGLPLRELLELLEDLNVV